MRRRAVRAGLAAAALVLALGASPGWLTGQETPPHSPTSAEDEDARTPAPTLDDLGFMAGCWLGGTRTLIEERWTPPSDRVMLGTTRYFREGRTVQFELATILVGADGITLLPYPGGRPSEDGFRLTGVVEGTAIFEAPEHDYPKRILYRLETGRLIARIDGGADDPEPRTWAMERVACEEPPPVTPG